MTPIFRDLFYPTNLNRWTFPRDNRDLAVSSLPCHIGAQRGASDVTGKENFFGPEPAKYRTCDPPHKNPTLYRVVIKACLYRKAVQVFIYIYPVKFKFTFIQKRCVNLLAGAPLRPGIHVAEIRRRAPTELQLIN